MGLTNSRGNRPSRLHCWMMGMTLSSTNLRVVSRTSRSSELRRESSSMKSTPLNLKTDIRTLFFFLGFQIHIGIKTYIKWAENSTVGNAVFFRARQTLQANRQAKAGQTKQAACKRIQRVCLLNTRREDE